MSAIDWNGEGLPPIGTVCEMQDGIGVWTRVEIFAVHCGYAHGWDGDKRISYFSSYAREFRPIQPTEEQVRAEAIEAMGKCFKTGLGLRALCEQLYDAGYRKFEIVDGEA